MEWHILTNSVQQYYDEEKGSIKVEKQAVNMQTGGLFYLNSKQFFNVSLNRKSKVYKFYV